MTEKSYRFRPLQYAECSVCRCECRRRGPVPWVHFDSAYWQGLRMGWWADHAPVVV